MDPNATLQQWREACARGDGTAAKHAREALRTWLASGGFEPTWASKRERKRYDTWCRNMDESSALMRAEGK